jgi:hypothetical protein
MELSWSRWFHCESSFGLLLVPDQSGIFALAEEVMQPSGPGSRRMLAVFEISEADNVSRALSRMFALGSPWHERLTGARCYLRYTIIPDAEKREAAAAALKNWLSSQIDTAAVVFESPLASRPGEMRSERRIARAEHEGEAAQRGGVLATNETRVPLRQAEEEQAATVAERAVDRVMAKPYFPNGF